MKIGGLFTLANSDSKGILRVVGTGETSFLPNSIISAQSGKCFVSGNIVNLSPVPVFLKIKIGGSYEDMSIELDGYDAVELHKQPFQEVRVALADGQQADLKASGFVVDDDNEEDLAKLLASSGFKIVKEMGRRYNYDSYKHTDINSAATTPLISVTSGKTIRVRSVTIAVDGACTLVLQFADSASSNERIIRQLNLSALGTYNVDLGDKGLTNPHFVDGLLELVSNNTAVLDVDVIYRED